LRRWKSTGGCSETPAFLPTRPSNQSWRPEKPFDLSRATVESRWLAGMLDMQEALKQFDSSSGAGPLVIVRRNPG
jgi:hypothetical protein